MVPSREVLLIAPLDTPIVLLHNIGLLLNNQKSILTPPLVLEFLAAQVDSQNMTRTYKYISPPQRTPKRQEVSAVKL